MKFSSKFVAAACVGVLVLAAEARADQPPPPELTLLSPADGFITNAPTITVTGVAFAAPGAGDVTVTLNSVPVPVNADGSFGGSFALAEWWNPVVLEATDGLGQTTDIYSSVVQDISPPSVWIFGVWDGFYSSAAAVNPVCGAADAYLATWSATLDGQPYNCGDSVTIEGVHTLVVNAADDADNTAATSATFVIDRTAPAVTVSGVTDGASVPGPVNVQVAIDEPNLDWTTTALDGDPIESPSFAVAEPGDHVITIYAVDEAANVTVKYVAFTILPSGLTATIVTPTDGTATNVNVVDVAVRIEGATGIQTATANGVDLVLSADGLYHALVPLQEGDNSIEIFVLDSDGTAVCEYVCLTLDTVPPTVGLSSPCANFSCAAGTVHVAGQASDASGIARVTVDGVAVSVDCEGQFSTDVALQPGTNVVSVVATDLAGNQTTTNVTSTCAEGNQAPVVDAGADQTLALPSVAAPPAFALAPVIQVAGAQNLAADSTRFIARDNGTLFVVSPNGDVSTLTGLAGPGPVTIAADGTIYAAMAGGTIARVTPDASAVDTAWASLPGETTFVTDGLAVNPGGNLIAATSTGAVWTVTPAGEPTKIASGVNATAGATIIPADAPFGDIAGKAVFAGENQIVAVDGNGVVSRYPVALHSPVAFKAVVGAGVFAGLDSTGTLWTTAAGQVDASLLALQQDGTVMRFRWNGSGFQQNVLSAGGGWSSAAFLPGVSPVPSASVQLHGVVTDDGLPNPPAAVSVLWSASGPGQVALADASQAATTASVSVPGTYALTLTASDSQLSATDQMVVVIGPSNHAPSVNAGGDFRVVVDGTTQLQGSATDDGLPAGHSLSFQWTQLSGPGAAVFSDASSASPTVVFDHAGTYQLQLTADDGELRGSDRVTAIVFDSQVVNDAHLSLSMTVAPTAAPGTVVTYLVTATDTGVQPLAATSGTITFPDLTQASLAFGPLSPGESQTLSFDWQLPQFDADSFDYPSQADYIGALHGADGVLFGATAHVPWTSVVQGAQDATAGAETIQQLPILSGTLTINSQHLHHFVPIAATLTLTNVGTAPALAPTFQDNAGWTTVGDLAPGASEQMDVTVVPPCPFTPRGEAGCISIDPRAYDLQSVQLEIAVEWSDAGNFYGDLEVDQTAVLVEPVIDATITGPVTAYYNQPLPFVLSGTNVGHDTALEVGHPSQVFGFQPDLFPLFDLAVGSSFSSTVISVAPPPIPRQQVTEADYQAFLRAPLDAGSFRVPYWGSLALIDQTFEFAEDVSSEYQILVPTLAVTWDIPQTVYLGQRVPLQQHLLNDGTTAAMNVMTRVVDNPFFDSFDNSGLVTAFGHDFGFTAPVAIDVGANVNLAPFYESPALPAVDSNASRYLDVLQRFPDRLNAISETTWQDALPNTFGPIHQPIQPRLVVPVVSTELTQSSSPLVPGRQASIPFSLRSLGTGTARAVHVALVAPSPGGSYDAPSPLDPAPSPGGTGGVASSTLPFTPPVPAPRGQAESSDDYVKRLQAAESAVLSVRTTWQDDVANTFGPTVLSTAYSIGVPIVRPLPMSVTALPGETTTIIDEFIGNAAPIAVVLTANGAPSPVALSGSVPARSEAQDDGAYLASLAAADGVHRSAATAATWTDEGGHSYGPTTGTADVMTIVPVLRTVFTAFATAAIPGDVDYKLTVTNIGHAPAQDLSAVVTFPDGTTQALLLPPVAPTQTVTASAEWDLPASAAGLLGAHVTVTWRDAHAGLYGPISAAVSTKVFPADGSLRVDAGRRQHVTLAQGADLQGTITESNSGHPISSWSQISGPGWASFANAASLTTHASFTENGTYLLRLTASDGQQSAEDGVEIDVTDEVPQNQPPVVSAGPDQLISPNASLIQRPFALTTITSNLSASSGLGDFPERNGLLASVHYFDGQPNNFELIHPDGTHAPFSNVHGLSDEIYFAIAHAERPDGKSQGGFDAGDIFAGTGIPGDVLRMHADGTLVANPWVHLPGETGTLRGGLVFDTVGTFGGDLIVITGSGNVWRVDSKGTPTLVGNAHENAEAIAVLPQDPLYGPAAGKIFYMSEGSGNAFAMSADGTFQVFTNIGISGAEKLAVIPPTGNFYVLNQGGSLFGATADMVSAFAGQILITEEFSGQIFRVRWNGTAFVKNLMGQIGPNSEGMTFSPILFPGMKPFASVQLAGVATDDGLPDPPGALQANWSFVDGPALVTFTDAASLTTQVEFPQEGTYTLQLDVTDSQLSASSVTHVVVRRTNEPPIVDAGADQLVTVGEAAHLKGTARDDGLPDGAALTFSWSVVSGTGHASFSDVSSIATDANFDTAGTYQLRLSVSDSALTTTSDLLVKVINADQPPQVSVGVDQTVLVNQDADLEAHFSGYQGRPVVGTWIFNSTALPRPLRFNATQGSNLFKFADAGTYQCILQVSDGDLINTAQVTVVVQPDNRGPLSISAGNPVFLSYPENTAALFGQILGNAAGGSIHWDLVSGPGAVTFSTPDSAQTLVTVQVPGVYQLALSASDGVVTQRSVTSLTLSLNGSTDDEPVPSGLWVTGHDPAAFITPVNLDPALELSTAASYLGGCTLQFLQAFNSGQFCEVLAITGPDAAADSDADLLSFLAPTGKATANPPSGWLDIATVDFSQYRVLVVDSDNQGRLRQADLDALNARRSDIVNYLNEGGALIVLPETGRATGGTTRDRYAFVPVSLTQTTGVFALPQPTQKGLDAGLTTSMVQSDGVRAVFQPVPGLDSMDVSGDGQSATLAARGAHYTLGSAGANHAPKISVAVERPFIDFSDPAGLTTALDAIVTDDGLPVGMSITVTWSQVSGPAPALLQSGTGLHNAVTPPVPGAYLFRATASDGEAAADAFFSVQVDATLQRPIVSAGDDQHIFMPLNSLELNGSVAAVTIPQGMLMTSVWSVDAGPGIVVFDDASATRTVAHFSAPGLYTLRLSATESAPGFAPVVAASTVTIGVIPDLSSGNQAPFVAIAPVPAITLPQQAVTLTAFVTDDGNPRGSVVTTRWQQVDGPGIATVVDPNDTTTGVTLPPIAGTYRFSLSASDTDLTSVATVDVVVLQIGQTNQPPRVSAGDSQTVDWGQAVVLNGAGSDDGVPGPLAFAWSFVAGSGEVTFASAASPQTTATFSWPGQYVLQFSASDGELSTSDQVLITVNPPLSAVPVVRLTSPDNAQRVTAAIPISGEVSDGVWRLELRLDGDDATANGWSLIASGTGAAAGTLGEIDPTQLLNGTYELRLRAVTSDGEAEDDRSFTVERNLKIGNFALAFTDAVLPLPGLPITVVRSYDSRDTRDGDFGRGWQLSVSDIRVEKSTVLGKFWQQSLAGSVDFPSYCLSPADGRPNFVTVTFPTGKVYKFQTKVDVLGGTTAGGGTSCQALSPSSTVDIVYTPIDGTVGSLAPLDGDKTVQVQTGEGAEIEPGPVQLIDLADSNVYNPRDFVLTVEDGTKYQVRQGVGLVSMIDVHGNEIDFTHDGISSPRFGKSMAFVRDRDGHIAQIDDPNGKSLLYGYDLKKQLVTFTDRDGNVTRFAYDDDGKLLTITDPAGHTVLANTWTAGRLASTADAAGTPLYTYTHDLDGHREVVTDREGHSTTYEYDTDGNVVRLTDALGHVTSSTYDFNDNKLSSTDALGHTTKSTYDARNNKLSETDPLGNTTSWTYDSLGKVLTTTDPLNHVTTNSRVETAVCGQPVANGDLSSTTDAQGHVTSFNYDCNGSLLSQNDARGGITSYGYDAAGRMTQMTDALGNVTTYAYDANGNQTTETRSRTVDGVAETLTTRYEYDGSSRRTKTTYADGTTSRTVYNSLGKAKQTIDQLARTTSYLYDDQGRLTTTTYPDGTTTVTAYDDLGRRASSTDRGGRTTTYAYDAVGRLTTTTFPDGASRTTDYDDVGRVAISRDELGHPTSYVYDDAGRRTQVIDALGNATTFGYDAVGNQTTVTDPLNHTVTTIYDELNRSRSTLYLDGTHEDTEYDAAGNRSAHIDQSGNRTSYDYDALNRLTIVTDALGGITSYGYDEVGDRTSQTDANRHTTTFAYDQIGRRISRTLPMGEVEHFTYFDDGQVANHTDFNGHTTTYAYDDSGRPTTRTPDAYFAAESPVSLTYYPSGRRHTLTDGTGTTTYAYDSRDRLLSKSTPEGSLTYTYDTQGHVASAVSDSGAYNVSYGYDALGRLSSVTDHAPGGGTTTYPYDAAGRLQSYAYPNGITIKYTYDALNRIQQMKLGSALDTVNEQLVASYAYTFYATGNRHTVAELSPRSVTWSYDGLWRLTDETVAGAVVAGAVDYGYDSVGNRLSRTSTLQGISNQASTYDNNDRLMSNGWDPNGNTLIDGSSQYGYDSENRLLSLNSTVARYVYDGDGQLSSKTVGGVATNYLIDAQTPAGYTQIVEERVGGAVTKSYVYGPQRIAMNDAQGVHYYGYDAHSGVRLLLDGAGNLTDTWDYDAFGNVIGRTGTTANDFTYRGEQMDAALGLQYLRARWLNPTSGRFATRDTFEGDGNLYLYGGANPTRHVDPSGHDFGGDMGSADSVAALGGYGAGMTRASLLSGAIGAGSGPNFDRPVRPGPMYPFFYCMCEQAFAARGLRPGFPFRSVYIDFRDLEGRMEAFADLDHWMIAFDKKFNGYGDPANMTTTVKAFWASHIAHEMFHMYDFYFNYLVPSLGNGETTNGLLDAIRSSDGARRSWTQEHWDLNILVSLGWERLKPWEDTAWSMQDYVAENYEHLAGACK